jgi:hypothetical protein
MTDEQPAKEGDLRVVSQLNTITLSPVFHVEKYSYAMAGCYLWKSIGDIYWTKEEAFDALRLERASLIKEDLQDKAVNDYDTKVHTE